MITGGRSADYLPCRGYFHRYYTDLDGDPLSFTLLSAPSYGTLVGTAPDLVYIPAPNYAGPDSFTFKVSDGEFDSAPAAVTIDVMAVDDPPVANHACSIAIWPFLDGFCRGFCYFAAR